MTKKTEKIFNKIKNKIRFISPNGNKWSITIILKEDRDRKATHSFSLLADSFREALLDAEEALKTYGCIE